MKRKIILFNIILFCQSFFLIAQEGVQSFFSEGNQFYNEGNYQKAIDSYGKIIDQNIYSVELYFNLGNAHYKLNNIAESIYYFEKAKQLAPKNKEVLNNLAFAKNMQLDYIEPLPQTQINIYKNILLTSFTPNEWAYLTIILGWVTWMCFFVFYIKKETLIKRSFFVGGTIFLIFFFISINLQIINPKSHFAILMESEISIRDEPNLHSTIKVDLNEGIKVKILDSLQGWYKISLTNGTQGWVEKTNIKKL